MLESGTHDELYALKGAYFEVRRAVISCCAKLTDCAQLVNQQALEN